MTAAGPLPIFQAIVDLPGECNVETARQHLSAGLRRATTSMLNAHRAGVPEAGIAVRSPIFKEYVDRVLYIDGKFRVALVHPTMAGKLGEILNAPAQPAVEKEAPAAEEAPAVEEVAPVEKPAPAKPRSTKGKGGGKKQ